MYIWFHREGTVHFWVAFYNLEYTQMNLRCIAATGSWRTFPSCYNLEYEVSECLCGCELVPTGMAPLAECCLKPMQLHSSLLSWTGSATETLLVLNVNITSRWGCASCKSNHFMWVLFQNCLLSVHMGFSFFSLNLNGKLSALECEGRIEQSSSASAATTLASAQPLPPLQPVPSPSARPFVSRSLSPHRKGGARGSFLDEGK